MKHEEWLRYRRQAEHTLQSARRDRSGGDHDWACFKAHQAAELGLKGYLRATREYVTGHALTRLLGLFASGPEGTPPVPLLDCARELDRVYVPSRYPDAYPEGAPLDYYTEQDAATAIDCAARILAWIDDLATS